ncbi:helix-turn-helix domain-containing protein [Kitasatospora sp. NPDC059146]|uniref:helix-turn-helix domain-containing protein n=1 Tax=Kitasatospora sp. NPDC059146 TaxID=3346741 RepID=UPI003694A5F5
MTQSQRPGRRGLAELDEKLPEPERRCAQRLRYLRDRIGLSSEELARRLSADLLHVDKTRLSKYLNGRDVPRREFAVRIHQVLAEQEGGEVSLEEVAQTRRVMYEAARARSPLQAREFELAEAREEIERQRRVTREQLGELREELRAERCKRQAAEEALADLDVHARDEVRALTEQRDAAERRVADLEQQIQQTEAVLRLQGRDARAMEDLASATDAELVLLGQADTASMGDLYQILVSWRDYDQDDQADLLLERLAVSGDVTLIFGLYEMFLNKERKLDASRILAATARAQDPVALFYFTRSLELPDSKELRPHDSPLTRWSPLESLELALNPSPAVRWVRDLPGTLVLHAPTESILRFHRACQENGADALGASLRNHVLNGCPEGWNSGDPREVEFYKLARAEAEQRERERKYRRSWMARWLER